ncbi:putative ribosomal protein S3 [Helianthus annuus]|uniref:Putative KH domain, prokaryotic type, KH domain-like, alpha/beta n=1 Tax=Helianthus annuus TaxID=4232 RepID=A0A251S0X5_HELAN|nr:putative ribosomal protein S3 [Helianthus annuus]KAJ0436886.1 putative K domain superfamily, prokaryotic type protein [Helianthus annuus]KAJ0459198.1 putative K domain superfamily, prokaryotic type protein [Helianthus annuus]KAJ0639754.1 putative K domain superfamily, prokaryotic type protein [Helianthus annuus]
MICIVIGNIGQKINPIGFRLGTTQGHHSLSFGSHNQNIFRGSARRSKNKKLYKELCIKNTKTSSGVEGIVRIEIQKRIDMIQIIIYMGFPKILIESRSLESKNYI